MACVLLNACRDKVRVMGASSASGEDSTKLLSMNARQRSYAWLCELMGGVYQKRAQMGREMGKPFHVSDPLKGLSVNCLGFLDFGSGLLPLCHL